MLFVAPHLNETRMRPVASALARLGLVTVFSILSGCTYVCHRYEPFEESVPEATWEVEGTVTRQHAEGKAPTKYSLPHWGAQDDDRYAVELVPVAPDSAFWEKGDVDVVGVKVIADSDTMHLDWLECEHTYENLVSERKALHSAGGYYSNTPYTVWYNTYGRRFADRRVTFVSEYFRLKKPVPKILVVEYELLIFDEAAEEPTSRWKFRSEAVIDRHRRWVIVDAIES